MARNHGHRIPCVLHSSRLITLLTANFLLLTFAWRAHIFLQIVYVAVLCQKKPLTESNTKTSDDERLSMK